MRRIELVTDCADTFISGVFPSKKKRARLELCVYVRGEPSRFWATWHERRGPSLQKRRNPVARPCFQNPTPWETTTIGERVVSRAAEAELVRALAAVARGSRATRGGAASLAAVCRAALVAAAARHGGTARRLNPTTGEQDDRVCFAAAELWLKVLTVESPTTGDDDDEWRDGLYDALLGEALGILARLDLEYSLDDDDDSRRSARFARRFAF